MMVACGGFICCFYFISDGIFARSCVPDTALSGVLVERWEGDGVWCVCLWRDVGILSGVFLFCFVSLLGWVVTGTVPQW